MRKSRGIAAAALVAGGLAATIYLAPALAAGGQSSADVVTFADMETAVGASHLTRTGDGVAATFTTTALTPRETATLWWVVFNDPAGCSDACGEDDIFIDGDPTKGINLDGVAAADIVVGYADGAVANASGDATFTVRLSEGAGVSEVLFGETPTLKDATGAEIHLVLRSHGPGIPGLIAEQTGSYAGGCEVFLHPPSVPTGPGECADTQFAVHLP